jgi:S-adenosylmethionine:tRNA ribosyltransferase-isomerase
MKLSEFDFDLPDDLIAQTPPEPRGASRLLKLDRATGEVSHHSIAELPRLLGSTDLVVINNTRVFPARLLGRRVPTGGAVECLLLGRLDAERWDALVHPGHKLRVGERIVFEAGKGPQVHGEILERHFFGRRTVRLWADEGDIDRAIDAIGHVPLPPYIKRDDSNADRERYQTVYARVRGSVAAPTAGLHFTDAILEDLQARGIERGEITLHVGYGTFKPIRTDDVEAHRVDAEIYDISPDTATRINAAVQQGRRVVAVGTTTVRTLEAAALAGNGRIAPGGATADLYIYPGYAFRVVRGLLTNFHLPRSSLFLLVCAFAGRDNVMRAYEMAIAERYRFYSYGDAMVII